MNHFILKEVADVQIGPFGSQLHVYDYEDSGIAVVMPTEILENHTLVLEKSKCVSTIKADELPQHALEEGDLLLSRRGDVTRSAQYKGSRPAICGTGSIRIRFDSDLIDSKYGAYIFQSSKSKEWLKSQAVGSTMPNLNSGILSRFPISLPPLPEQQRIAGVLSAFDDKIDVLRRQNATLEAMAQAVFREWFVERREQNGLLSDLAKNIRIPTKSQDIDPDETYIALNHIAKKSITLIDQGLGKDATSNKSRFSKGDTLFGKLRVYFHKVCIAPFDGVCSTDILVVRAKNPALRNYVTLSFSQSELIDYADGASTGTRMPRTNWKTVSNFPAYIPKEEELEEFNLKIDSIIRKLEVNRDDIGRLATLKDFALKSMF